MAALVTVMVAAPSLAAAEPRTLSGPVALVEPWTLADPVAPVEPEMSADQRWPGCPKGHGLSLEDQITERITQLGNLLGKHLDLLSDDMFQLNVDARRRHARFSLGGGEGQGLIVRLDGDIQLDDITAHVRTRVDLGYQGHLLRLELPDVEVAPAEYRGDYGVEVRLPVFAVSF